jgi:hypothetical protein
MFELIKTRTRVCNVRHLFLGDICLAKQFRANGKLKFEFLPKNKVNKEKMTFFLKVNRLNSATMFNLQQWLDVIAVMGADFYILCDNRQLKTEILKKNFFKDADIKFLKSRRGIFNRIADFQKLAPSWVKAAEAHLSTYWYSKKFSLKEFWNIDADDSFLSAPPEKVAHLLSQAQDIARAEHIDNFSFDFWHTKTEGRHWSFGATYTQNLNDTLKILESHAINWPDYKKYTTVYNLDWVFTHLGNINQLNNKTFYVEGLLFYHWGEFFYDLKNCYLAYWENERMIYPIMNDIYKDSRAGIRKIPLSAKLIKLSPVCSIEESREYSKKVLNSKYYLRGI